MPHRFERFVNIDGLPTAHPRPERTEQEWIAYFEGELARSLDHGRESRDRSRRPGTLDELAERRRRMNPRLSLEWLRYLVTAGASHAPDGWRWKVDPVLRFGGFGPWRPEWSLSRLPGLGVPMLVIVGEEAEPMGWGSTREQIEPWLPDGTPLEFLAGVGHFAHIEDPGRVAEMALEFLS
jgi:pimeloyl-ACP methyl ester carboxylesterase